MPGVTAAPGPKRISLMSLAIAATVFGVIFLSELASRPPPADSGPARPATTTVNDRIPGQGRWDRRLGSE
jgi:hypothetical protein